MATGNLIGRSFRGFSAIGCCLLWPDPVADIAVLGEPDSQELSDKHDAYVALTDPVVPFTIGALEFVQQQLRLPGEGRFSGVVPSATAGRSQGADAVA